MFAALAAADIGVKLSYMPLLAILLPAKAQALDGASAPVVVSALGLAGALVASVVNLGVGWLSDHGGTRFGRRRWVLGGVTAICVGYAMLGVARTPRDLLAAVLLLQVAINCTIAPLLVLVAQRFFRRPSGFVVGAGGASQPIASFIGAAVTAVLIPFGVAAYVVVGVLTAALVAPFVLMRRNGAARADMETETDASSSPVHAAGSAPPGRADLLRLWAWRFALQLTASLSAPYALFRLRDAEHGADGGAVGLTLGVSLLTLIASCAHLLAAVVVAGAVSRGLARRDAARLAALVLTAAMAVFVFARGPAAFVAAFLLMGLGAGAGQVADTQLALDLLPSRRTLGRDLGVLNLAYTLPQMIAPLFALSLPGVREGKVGLLFALAGLASLAAAAIAGGLTRRASAQEGVAAVDSRNPEDQPASAC